MSESLRDLVVSLSLKSENFERNVKSINKQIREVESGFKLAGAGVDDFESSLQGLESKRSSLKSTIELQKQAVEQYARALEAAEKKLQDSVKNQESAAARLAQSKAKYAELSDAVEKAGAKYQELSSRLGETDDETLKAKGAYESLKKELEGAGKEVTKLEKAYAATQRATLTAADSVTAYHTKLNDANRVLKETEAAAEKSLDAITDFNNGWNRDTQAIQNAEASVKSMQGSMNALNSELQLSKAEFDATGNSIEYYSQRLSTLNAELSINQTEVQRYEQALAAAKSMYEAAYAQNDGGKISIASDAINKAQASLNAARAKVVSTQNAIAACNRELTLAKNGWTAADKSFKSSSVTLKTLSDRMSEIDDAIKVLNAEEKEYGQTTETLAERTELMNQKYKIQQEVVTEYAKQLEAAKTQLQAAQEANDPAKIEQATVAVSHAQSALNGAQSSLSQTESKIASLNAELARNSSGWSQVADSLDDYSSKALATGQKITNIGRDYTNNISRPLLNLGKSMLSSAIDQEDAFARVRKTIDATDKEYAVLDATATEMSERLATSYEDIANAMSLAGQMGIRASGEITSSDNAIANFTETMLKLSMAADSIDLETATQQAAKFANIMGMSEDNYERFGSAITDLGNKTATTEGEILNMSMQLAGSAKQVGLTEAEVLGISAGLSSLGINAERGGSAFSKVLKKMEVASVTGGKALDDFAKVSGMTAKDFATLWQDKPVEAFKKFIFGLSQYDEKGLSAIATLNDMGLTEVRLSDTILRTTAGQETFNEAIDIANNAWRENIALQKETDNMLGTTKNKYKNVQNAIENMQRKFGDTMLKMAPTFSMLLDKLSGVVDWFDGLDESVKHNIIMAGALVAAVGPVLNVFGKFASGAGMLLNGLSKVSAVMEVFGYKIAAAGGGLAGFGSVLFSSPVAIAAVTVACIAGAGAFYDWASGAKAAREAADGLSKSVDNLKKEGFKGIYDTANTDMLASFGFTEESFQQSVEQGNWFDKLIETWTDGKKETNEIVKSFTDEFTDDTDDVRTAIDNQKSLLDGFGVLDDATIESMKTDMATLDDIDSEVTQLLKKRQNGYMSEEDQARLQELIALREEIARKWGTTTETTGYDGIQSQLAADIEMAKSLGKTLEGTRYGEALTALGQGYQATVDQINAGYKEQYDQIMQIQDADARNAALNELNTRYAEQMAAASEEYRTNLAETAGVTFKENGLSDATDKVTELSDILEEIRKNPGDPNADSISAITDWVDSMSGGDMAKLQSLYSLIMQMRGAGTDDADIASALGYDKEEFSKLMSDIELLKQIANGNEGLEGLSSLFGTMDENAAEVLTLTLGIDSEEAATQIQTFIDSYKDTSVNVDVALETLTQEAITAWNAANSGTKLTGPMASVGLQLGADAATTLKTAWNNKKLAVYGPNGLPLEVTPAILNKITDKDVCAYDEDGTLHVIITPEVGTEEYVDYAKELSDQEQHTIFNIDNGSTSKQMAKLNRDIENYEHAIDKAQKAKDKMDKTDDFFEKDQLNSEKNGWLTAAGDYIDKISSDIDSLTDEDIDNIANQIMALYEVLENPDLDDSARTDYENQLKSLLDLTDYIDTYESGDYVSQGIAEGMVNHGWSGDASTLASNISDAVNNALGIASPSRLMKPTGAFVSAGIGAGMSEYKFNGEASSVASSILSAFSGTLSHMESIGAHLMSGIAAGIRSGRSTVVNAMVESMREAIQAAKNAAEIKSPSHVMRDEVGVMMMRGVGVGITNETKAQEKAIRNAMNRLVSSATSTVGGSYIGGNNRTYNRNSTVNLNVATMSVSDQQDIRSLAIEIAGISKSDMAMHGQIG